MGKLGAARWRGRLARLGQRVAWHGSEWSSGHTMGLANSPGEHFVLHPSRGGGHLVDLGLGHEHAVLGAAWERQGRSLGKASPGGWVTAISSHQVQVEARSLAGAHTGASSPVGVGHSLKGTAGRWTSQGSEQGGGWGWRWASREGHGGAVTGRQLAGTFLPKPENRQVEARILGPLRGPRAPRAAAHMPCCPSRTWRAACTDAEQSPSTGAGLTPAGRPHCSWALRP